MDNAKKMHKYHIGYVTKDAGTAAVPEHIVVYKPNPYDALYAGMRAAGKQTQDEFRVLDMMEEIEPNKFVIVFHDSTRKFADHLANPTVDILDKEPWERAVDALMAKQGTTIVDEDIAPKPIKQKILDVLDEEDWKDRRPYMVAKDI